MIVFLYYYYYYFFFNIPFLNRNCDSLSYVHTLQFYNRIAYYLLLNSTNIVENLSTAFRRNVCLGKTEETLIYFHIVMTYIYICVYIPFMCNVFPSIVPERPREREDFPRRPHFFLFFFTFTKLQGNASYLNWSKLACTTVCDTSRLYSCTCLERTPSTRMLLVFSTYKKHDVLRCVT